MAVTLETWSDVEVHSEIQLLHAQETKTGEIHQKLVSLYGENVMSKKHLFLV
jgi:hypothetical protein